MRLKRDRRREQYVSLSTLTREFDQDAGHARGSTWGSAAVVDLVKRRMNRLTSARVGLESLTHRKLRADDQVWRNLGEFEVSRKMTTGTEPAERLKIDSDKAKGGVGWTGPSRQDAASTRNDTCARMMWTTSNVK